ncbi:MAG TPA: Ig-like domain-containing protein [Blastocatellia bacterium]|nr:Ig-like domain-containing protein [Blastocatellia bacterium]
MFGNTPPTVAITVPSNGATFTAPATISISANASDVDGTVTKVEFFANSTLLNTDTSAPYKFVWSGVGAGAYSLTAKATDNQGASTTSSPVNVSVGGPSNNPPTISITSPANGATFTAPAAMTITASASDSDGSISKVEFFSGPSLIGTDTSAPYSFTWTNVAAGTYDLSAKATDNLGANAFSATVRVTVSATGNIPPSVSITSPADSTAYTAPATVTIAAAASDSDGTVTKVDFFAGATLVGTDSVAPYVATWSNVPAGSYSLTARATDNVGATSTSIAVAITVNNPPNTPPSVSITSPVNGAAFTAPANILIAVTASDGDGFISKVEFFGGGALIGTSTTPPYSVNWSSVAAGNYQLTARATDNLGASATSAPVSITVSGAGNVPPTVTITTPLTGAVFAAPANIPINANASDSDGTVSKVEFLAGNTLLGTVTSPPYKFIWTGVGAGSYTLIARATDNGGAISSHSVAVTVTANNCSFIQPSGDGSGESDSTNIENCLSAAGHAGLTPGQFYINRPITFPFSFSSISGAGSASTTVTAVFPCSQGGPIIDANGQGRTLTNINIRDFFLDLTNVVPGCADAMAAVRFIRSNDGQVSGMTMQNSGASGIGVSLVKSSNVVVANNEVRDFTGGGTAAGIQVADSASATIDGNRVIRASFGIIVRNFGNVGPGLDSSNTTVTNNTLIGRFGRAMKLQSSDATSVPLRNVTVRGNSATDFRTGLYLTGGVLNSTIENNSFDGGFNSLYALWVGSINPGEEAPGLNPSLDNQINLNTFIVRGCESIFDGCFDVSFNGEPSGNNAAGPDQPTISRISAGNNTLGTRGIEPTPFGRTFSFGCSQYSHAWFDYLNGLNYVPQGGQILLASAGTYPGTRVTYHFLQNGVEMASRTTNGTTASNCVLNQELYQVNLAPGLYDVKIDMTDGNARYPDAFSGPGVPIAGRAFSIRLDVR